MENDHLNKVDFDIIRYANCWEDADILLKALNIDKNSTVLSIASAGDNCFSLASKGPKKVIAVDISAVQLSLVELKMKAIELLDRSDYMKFAGFTESTIRKDTYQEIRKKLSENGKNYWDNHLKEIELGIIHCGKFEQYFQLFKHKFLHTFHSQEIVDGLFKIKTKEEQEVYYNELWYKPQWKEKHAVFFGEQMLGEKGRDPEFLKHVEGSVAENILSREIAHVSSTLSQKNHLLFYILNNRFDEAHLPHYVRKENYQSVKDNLHKIALQEGLIGKVVENYPSCTHFNLSNIFEYMTVELFEKISRKLIQSAAPKAQFAFWNFMIERNMVNSFPDRISYREALSKELTNEDLGYFYKAFILNVKK